MPPVLRIDTIFVPAIDTSAAAEWYRRLFDMVEIFRSAQHIGLRFAGAPSTSTALTLIPVERIDPNTHVAFNFYAPDPEALRESLIAAGSAVTPINTNGAMSWFDFTDFSGNRVNVCHFPGEQ